MTVDAEFAAEFARLDAQTKPTPKTAKAPRNVQRGRQPRSRFKSLSEFTLKRQHRMRRAYKALDSLGSTATTLQIHREFIDPLTTTGCLVTLGLLLDLEACGKIKNIGHTWKPPEEAAHLRSWTYSRIWKIA